MEADPSKFQGIHKGNKRASDFKYLLPEKKIFEFSKSGTLIRNVHRLQFEFRYSYQQQTPFHRSLSCQSILQNIAI